MKTYEFQDDGSRRQTGPVIRKKGDAYLNDCNVTGSTYGTDSDPKFPFITLFKEVIFLMVDNMVRPGEKYEGYTHIFQGNNAGPHQDAVSVIMLLNTATTRHHIKLARECGGLRALKQNETWNTAELIWKNYLIIKIASAYVQAHRIRKRVGGSTHIGIRADFQETDYGLVRQDGATLQPPVATQNDSLIGDLV
eukprot:10813555-Ditylum_brightwellii.AAC.1